MIWFTYEIKSWKFKLSWINSFITLSFNWKETQIILRIKISIGLNIKLSHKIVLDTWKKSSFFFEMLIILNYYFLVIIPTLYYRL